MNINDIYPIKTLVILFFLIIASYQDIKKREIDDKIWILMFILSFPITFLEIGEIINKGETLRLILYIISAITGVLLSFSFGYFGLTGGADAKALIVLSLNEVPINVLNPLPTLPFLSILINTVIFSLSYSIYIFIKNIIFIKKGGELFSDINVNMWMKIIGYFTVNKIKFKEFLEKRYKYTLAEEYIDGEKVLKLDIFIEEDSDDSKLAQYDEEDLVYVTPLMPMIVYILLGYIFYKAYGCILDIII